MVQNNLFNRKNKEQLIHEQLKETFKRQTCSLYRYVKITDPQSMRDILYKEWLKLKVLGRVYLAKEGINAQISVPKPNWTTFITKLNNHVEFSEIHIKKAVIEALVEKLEPLQKKFRDLTTDRDVVREILRHRTERAAPIAEKTMQAVRQRVGLYMHR